jgi:hypothetical protein
MGGLSTKGTANIQDGACVAQSIYSACTILEGDLPAAEQAEYDQKVSRVTQELSKIVHTLPSTAHLSKGSCFHISVVTKYFTQKQFRFEKLTLSQTQAKALLLNEANKERTTPTDSNDKDAVYWTVGYINRDWFPDAAQEEGFNPWHVSVFHPAWQGKLVGSNAGALKNNKMGARTFKGRVWCGLFDDSQRPLVFEEARNNSNGLGNYMSHLQLYKVTKK